MLITIGICTNNIKKLIKHTLKSINNLSIPKRVNVELIIINQSKRIASTKIIESHCSKKYKVVCVNNDLRGISHARNLLFKKSNGDYLFTTDDDGIVSKNWILVALKTFKIRPKAGIVYGKTQLLNQLPTNITTMLKDSDLSENWIYSVINPSSKFFEYNKVHENYPLFLNMAIKNSVYKKIKIDTRFGNMMGVWKIYGGEDPDFIEKSKLITKIYFNSKMIVKHNIDKNKMNLKYAINRYWYFAKEVSLIEYKYNYPKSLNPKIFLGDLINYIKGPDVLKNRVKLMFDISYTVTIVYFVFTSLDRKRWKFFHYLKAKY